MKVGDVPAVLVQTYYTTEGDKVFEHRKIGDRNWEKILTPFKHVPYVINTYFPETEIELRFPLSPTVDEKEGK